MTDRPDPAWEALAAWLAEEAALYETAAGQLDGIPFETVAHVFRVIEARIRRGEADAALTASGYAIVPAADVGKRLDDNLIIEIAVCHSNYKEGASEFFSHQRILEFARDIESRVLRRTASHLERLAAENERLKAALRLAADRIAGAQKAFSAIRAAALTQEDKPCGEPGTAAYALAVDAEMTDPTPRAGETRSQALARRDYYRGYDDDGLPSD